MSAEAVVEESRNLDGDRFRVTLSTSAGNVNATLLLAEGVSPPFRWTVGEWGNLVSDVVDERPEGAMRLTCLVSPVAYRPGLAAFVNVSDDDESDEAERDSAWVAGRSETGVSLSVIGRTPIPAKVYAHEGAGDDDTPHRAWAGEIEDLAPFVADIPGASASGAASAGRRQHHQGDRRPEQALRYEVPHPTRPSLKDRTT